MNLVVLESPLRATDVYSLEQHRRYLELAIQDAFSRGEAPYFSHVYADVLDDDNPQQRAQGIAAGLLWSAHCDYAVIMRDLGVSAGMQDAIKYYERIGKRWEWRSLGPNAVKIIQEMA